MQPSQNLISYLKGVEGFRSRPYLDPPHNTSGLYSIGYGHQIRPNEKYLFNKALTEQEATVLLMSDLKDCVNQTNNAFKRTPSQGLFDAAVDLAFNAGPGAMRKVVNTWNTTGDSARTARHLLQYNKSKVAGILLPNKNLTARRARAAGWFSGVVAEVEQPKYLLMLGVVVTAIFIMNYLRKK